MIYRVAGVLLILALIVGGFLILSTRHERPAEVNLEQARPPEADLKLHSIHYTETDNGRMVWELVADSAQFFKDELSTVLENAKVTFYGAEGQVFTLEAERGTLENTTKNITIRGNVLGTTGVGDTIRTDSLLYLASERMIETGDLVRMTRSGLRVTGKGMECRLKDGTITLLSDVRASLDSPPAQKERGILPMDRGGQN